MITESVETVLAYYTQPCKMSDPGEHTALLRALPDDLPTLVHTLHGLMLHVFWAERYGVKLSEERQAEVQIRPVRRKITRLLEIDSRPLTEARPPELRLVGNCRDFSLMLASILRVKGIPARARCGYGTYFMPGHYEDHWMTEVWNAVDARWMQVDAQLDELQQEVLGIQFDPLDMPPGQFVLGGQGWQLCRQGEGNPDDFGIFEFHGWDFVKSDLLHDLRSLNKLEVLPWDAPGLNQTPLAECSPAQIALLDQVAAATLAGNSGFNHVRSLYETHAEFLAPVEWSD